MRTKLNVGWQGASIGRAALALVLLAGCTRGQIAARSGAELRGQTPTNPAIISAVPSPPRRFTQGEVLYLRQCADCHGWTGRGEGPLATVLEKKPPNLRQSEVFTQYSEAELIAWILHGKELAVSVDLATLPHTETEATALLVHLKRLPTLAWQEVKAGEKVYDSLCVACHGVHGRGDGRAAVALSVPPRDLTNPSYQSQVSDTELLRIVSEGKGGMPGAADVLSSQELHAVITFLRVLSPGYELYDRFCAVCHGADGHPPLSAPRDRFGFGLIFQNMPIFDHEYFRTHTDDQVRTSIQHMRKQSRAAMPHFAGELNADQASQILGYLRSLPPES